MTLDRRQFLTLAGAVATTAVAGCSSSGDTTTLTGDTVDVPSDAADYLSNVSNFTGDALDETGQQAVTIEVGVQGNGGYNGFGPAAVAVSTGTTVTWEWTGQGAAHNVVAENGDYHSGTAELGTDITFEHTFESTGVSKYYCSPHKVQGMKGIVVVE